MKDNKDVVREEDREDYNPWKEDKEFRKRSRRDVISFFILIIIFIFIAYMIAVYGGPGLFR